jgi:hypothetical protein
MSISSVREALIQLRRNIELRSVDHVEDCAATKNSGQTSASEEDITIILDL